MLLQFRNITKGWIATIIVGLVGLATVLFLIPNSGLDFGGNNAVATVGGRSITPRELTRELELTLRGERQNGNPEDPGDSFQPRMKAACDKPGGPRADPGTPGGPTQDQEHR